MAEFPLKHGAVCIVDDSDAEIFLSRRWVSQRSDQSDRKFYVASYSKTGTVYLHRLLLNAPKGAFVDHINGNPLDNRRANLRLATPSQNSANSKRPKPSSGFKGVYWRESSRTFAARIMRDGKFVTLGAFRDPAVAARLYDEEAERIFGEFAVLNFAKDEVRA